MLKKHLYVVNFKALSMFKLFLLLYADDIVIFADNENMLQNVW